MLKIDKPVKRGSRNEHNDRKQRDSLTDSVPYLVQVVARLQTADFMSTLAGTHVHPAEAYVIHELWKASPLSQSKLSERLDVGNAAVGKTLTRLEKGGFIVRSRLPSDGRRVMVRLTDKGLAVHHEFHMASEALIDEIAGLLGTAGNRRFHQSLKVLAEHFRDRLILRRAAAKGTASEEAAPAWEG